MNIHSLKPLSTLLIIPLIFSACANSDKQTPRELFNGENLENFYTYTRDFGRDSPENAKVFSVQDGAIRITGEHYGCITTFEEFENYMIELEYKWGEQTFGGRAKKARDTGLLIHSVDGDGSFHKTWMHSIEVNIVEGGTGDFWVVGDKSEKFSLTCPAVEYLRNGKKAFRFDAKNGIDTTIHTASIGRLNKDPNTQDVKGFRGIDEPENPHGEWNKLTVIAKGDTITVYLNGRFLNKAYNVRPTKGKIQLQSEGAEVFYRRVTITPLQ